MANSAPNRARLYALLDQYRSSPCKDCGHSFPPYVMEFDHRPETKKLACVTTMAGRNFSKKRILAEIAKCDVVCSNCHKCRSHARGQHRKPAPSGG